MTISVRSRIAIVGAGPSGFYAAEQLLESGFEVDVYDTLPTPYGLVRAGVAPDHPKIKSVTRVYARTAQNERFRFFGGVTFGLDVSRDDLAARYHATVYAIGAATDNRLGIPGEDLKGSYPATEFVAWYNGHPDGAHRHYVLDCPRAVVIGNGNVAIDVARMLVLDPAELRLTDAADHAIDAFDTSAVHEVVLLGRRGPAEAAFTNPELRELGDLHRIDVVVDPGQLDRTVLHEQADATKRRNLETLRDYARRETRRRSHRIDLRFLRSPIEILGDDCVTGVRVAINELVERDGRTVARPTGEEEVIECGMVLRSIGYRGSRVDGVPFDDVRGTIRNVGGRVTNEDGTPQTGEYAVGWIKRGPAGVIGTNKKDAADTVAKICADTTDGRLREADLGPRASEAITDWITERVPNHVTWTGWESIDAHETALGKPLGRPRVKVVDRDELLEIGRGLQSAR